MLLATSSMLGRRRRRCSPISALCRSMGSPVPLELLADEDAADFHLRIDFRTELFLSAGNVDCTGVEADGVVGRETGKF